MGLHVVSAQNVGVDDWLQVWAGLLPGCMGMMNFPIWLRLLPKQLFRMIDRNSECVEGTVSFYTAVGVTLPAC